MLVALVIDLRTETWGKIIMRVGIALIVFFAVYTAVLYAILFSAGSEGVLTGSELAIQIVTIFSVGITVTVAGAILRDIGKEMGEIRKAIETRSHSE